MVPEGLRYTKEHEWIKVEGDRGRVGITHFAQEQLGDVVFVELPKVGRQLKAMEVFGVVESVMARLRLVQVPSLLVAACLLSSFGIVLLVR